MSDNKKAGYKKPPVANRFGPGQSGNPKGRPPKRPGSTQRDPLDIIMAVLTEPVPVKANNRHRQMPAIEAVAQRVARMGANGNSRAARMWWELVDLVFAWENRHIPHGQMEIVYVDWEGNVLPEAPTPTPMPPNWKTPAIRWPKDRAKASAGKNPTTRSQE